LLFSKNHPFLKTYKKIISKRINKVKKKDFGVIFSLFLEKLTKKVKVLKI